MISHERHPTLGRNGSSGSPVLQHIASNGSRRDSDTQFQEYFSSVAFFTPSWVVPAISTISCRRSAGIRGLPRGLDFMRQNTAENPSDAGESLSPA
jgi:hypothetical protein